jgi:hypothetical protein
MFKGRVTDDQVKAGIRERQQVGVGGYHPDRRDTRTVDMAQ